MALLRATGPCLYNTGTPGGFGGLPPDDHDVPVSAGSGSVATAVRNCPVLPGDS